MADITRWIDERLSTVATERVGGNREHGSRKERRRRSSCSI